MRNCGSTNWGRTLEARDRQLGDELGSDVGSSVGKPGCERTRARSALEPFLFWKYLYLPRRFVIPEEFLFPYSGR